jgi:enoyl-CoA hydratase/carnithine racemase
MNQTEVLYTTAGHIATVRLNAPERLNALRPAMIEELFAAADEALRDDEVRVVVLTGNGAAFCDDEPAPPAESTNGVDASQQQLHDFFATMHRDFTDALLQLDKPTIAAIHGRATGAGCDLALTCDMRIAAEDAQIATMHLTHGLVPGVTTYLLPRIVGLGKACELLFTGDAIDGREAGRIGLVDDVVPLARLEEATYLLAERVAKGPPVAMRFTKRALYRGLSSTMGAAKEYTTMARTLGMRITEETREGFQSFVEKRAPKF